MKAQHIHLQEKQLQMVNYHQEYKPEKMCKKIDVPQRQAIQLKVLLIIHSSNQDHFQRPIK
jgi:hypothetical protein